MPANKITNSIYLVGDAMATHACDCAVYAVLGSGATLIDCGSGMGHEKLIRNLAKIGVAPQDIDCVIGTHGHYDHLAGMERLRQDNPDIRLALHENDAEQIEQADPERTCAGDWFYGEDMWPQQVDVRFAGGETFESGGREFEIIHTPGHTPGSICIRVGIDDKTAIFIGDCFTPGNQKVRSDFHEWKQTIDDLSSLEFDLLLPGHSGYMMMNPLCACLVPPISEMGGRQAYRLIHKLFLKPFWRVGTMNYSYLYPAVTKLSGRIFKR